MNPLAQRVRPIILAQSTDLPSVPDSTLTWVLIILISICLIAAALYAAFRKSGPVKIDDNPPPEYRKAPKRYNHDATEQRFVRAENRLDGHDTELDRLWQTLRVDLPEMERRINKAGEDRIEKVREQVNQVLEKIGELKGRVE